MDATTAAAALAGRVEWLEAQDLLDELCAEQIALSAKLAGFELAVLEHIEVLAWLEPRARSLRSLRDALAVLQLAAASRCLQRAFLPDAPLADYLRGVYAWLFAVLRALEHLAFGLREDRPDWATFRWRIEEAKNFHFDELEGDVLHDLLRLREQGADASAVGRGVAAYDVVLAEARALEHRLEAIENH